MLLGGVEAPALREGMMNRIRHLRFSGYELEWRWLVSSGICVFGFQQPTLYTLYELQRANIPRTQGSEHG